MKHILAQARYFIVELLFITGMVGLLFFCFAVLEDWP